MLILGIFRGPLLGAPHCKPICPYFALCDKMQESGEDSKARCDSEDAGQRAVSRQTSWKRPGNRGGSHFAALRSRPRTQRTGSPTGPVQSKSNACEVTHVVSA